MTQQTHCTHEGCKCAIPQDRAATNNRYCSEYCEQHSSVSDHQAHTCSCGHTGCQGH